MSEARTARLLRPLLGKLERYLVRAGLVAFMADPVAAAPAAPAPAPAAAPAADPPAAPAPAPAAPAPAPAAPAPAPAAAAPAAAPAASPAPAPAGAPEKYELKLPEGVQADEAVMGEFTTWAKEQNLTQEAAQKVIDLQAKVAAKNSQAIQQAIEEHWKPVGGTPDKWEALAKADKEFGGEKFDENMAAAAAARDRFGTPLLKEVLNRTGAANHPEVLRFFLKVGRAISEDGFVPGRGGDADSGKPIAQRMFPNMNP